MESEKLKLTEYEYEAKLKRSREDHTYSEFRCPSLNKEKENPYVDLEYCQSFCFDRGCKELPTCKAVKLFKGENAE